jgi:hypothetical protein
MDPITPSSSSPDRLQVFTPMDLMVSAVQVVESTPTIPYGIAIETVDGRVVNTPASPADSVESSDDGPIAVTQAQAVQLAKLRADKEVFRLTVLLDEVDALLVNTLARFPVVSTEEYRETLIRRVLTLNVFQEELQGKLEHMSIKAPTRKFKLPRHCLEVENTIFYRFQRSVKESIMEQITSASFTVLDAFKWYCTQAMEAKLEVEERYESLGSIGPVDLATTFSRTEEMDQWRMRYLCAYTMLFEPDTYPVHCEVPIDVFPPTWDNMATVPDILRPKYLNVNIPTVVLQPRKSVGIRRKLSFEEEMEEVVASPKRVRETQYRFLAITMSRFIKLSRFARELIVVLSSEQRPRQGDIPFEGFGEVFQWREMIVQHLLAYKAFESEHVIGMLKTALDKPRRKLDVQDDPIKELITLIETLHLIIETNVMGTGSINDWTEAYIVSFLEHLSNICDLFPDLNQYIMSGANLAAIQSYIDVELELTKPANDPPCSRQFLQQYRERLVEITSSPHLLKQIFGGGSTQDSVFFQVLFRQRKDENIFRDTFGMDIAHRIICLFHEQDLEIFEVAVETLHRHGRLWTKTVEGGYVLKALLFQMKQNVTPVAYQRVLAHFLNF